MGEEEVVKRSVSRDNEILETSPLHSCAENRSLPDLLSLSLSAREIGCYRRRSIARRACATHASGKLLFTTWQEGDLLASPRLATPHPNHPVITIADRPEPITSAIFASKRSEDRLAAACHVAKIARIRFPDSPFGLIEIWEISQFCIFVYIYICMCYTDQKGKGWMKNDIELDVSFNEVRRTWLLLIKNLLDFSTGYINRVETSIMSW